MHRTPIRVGATTLLAAALSLGLATPATADDGPTGLECGPDYGFGPNSPSAYFCRDSNGPSPWDDCVRYGVRPIDSFPIEGSDCEP